MVEIEAKSYVKSRLKFFKQQAIKAKRKHKRVERQFWKIESPTFEDLKKVSKAEWEYRYFFDVVMLLENAPAERSEA